MSNVEKFYPADAAKNPDNVLEQSMGEYQDVLVLGYDHDGEIEVRASIDLDAKGIVFLMEHFKHKILSGDCLE